MNPNLPESVEPDGVLLDVDLRDKAGALACIAVTIARTHALDAAPVLRALERREQAASTGMGGGFAIPHARIGGLDRAAIARLTGSNAGDQPGPVHRVDRP